MSVVVYPGTFDPLTLGHVEVVKRAASLFDSLVIAVAESAGKNPHFSLADRLLICEETFFDIKNVTIEVFNGLLVDFVQSKKANIILRGLRGVSDLDFEFQLAEMNRRLFDQCETLFIKASDVTSWISSSLVREIAMMGGDIASFVPPAVIKRINKN